MTITDTECYDSLVRSRIQLLIQQPFFGILALSLKLEEDNNCKTAATDGEKIFYYPNFINPLTEGEKNWLLCHEILHVALGHLWRNGSRSRKRFNYATDYAIHCMLMEIKNENDANPKSSFKFQMPAGGLYNKDFDGLSAEEIYELLPDMPTNSGTDGDTNGTLDDHSMWDDTDSSADAQQKAKEWERRMIQAMYAAENKKQGTIPCCIKRAINKLEHPQKNWRQLLAEFIETETFDYGFTPPDHRLFGVSEIFGDILMPSFSEEIEKLKDFIFAIDTSGSIDEKELTIFVSELAGLLAQFGNKVRGHIIFCDAGIPQNGVFDFDGIDELLSNFKPVGGGGTSFVPPFEYTKEKMNIQEWDVAGLIYLTDGYGTFPDELDVPFRTFWAITNEKVTPKFGTIARLKVS